MTQGAMFSAAFVVISIMVIGAGLGYAGYIDFIVPVFIVMIYLKCGLRYTILSSITSLILIAFVIGNVPSSIFMSQSMILGIIFAKLILKKESIYDDLFYGAISACFVMILIDINFSTLTNYSFIKESQNYINALSNIPKLSILSDTQKDIIYYGSIAVLPLGTVFIVYFLSIFGGKRFKILNSEGMRKYNILKNFKKYGGYISCSSKTLIIGTVYIILSLFIEKTHLLDNFSYVMVILKSVQYIVLFFVIQDSFNFVNKFIFGISRSRGIFIIGQLIILMFLMNRFIVTSICLILGNLFIQKKFKIREKQNNMLNYAMENSII